MDPARMVPTMPAVHHPYGKLHPLLRPPRGARILHLPTGPEVLTGEDLVMMTV